MKDTGLAKEEGIGPNETFHNTIDYNSVRYDKHSTHFTKCSYLNVIMQYARIYSNCAQIPNVIFSNLCSQLRNAVYIVTTSSWCYTTPYGLKLALGVNGPKNLLSQLTVS